MIHCAEEFQNIVLSCFDHAHMVRPSYSSGLFLWLCTTKKVFLIRIESTYHRSLFDLTAKQTEVISASLSSPLLHEEHRENRLRQANHRITVPQPLRERIGQRWTTFHISQRLNPSEQFLSQSPPGSPQHIHYSCERQGEHVGKLGLAADLWCLINGTSVLRLGSSGPESCWVLKWWSDKQRNWAKTNTSSIQLFISNWKGRAQSRTSDLIWRIASALWIHQTRQRDKPGGFSLFGENYFSLWHNDHIGQNHRNYRLLTNVACLWHTSQFDWCVKCDQPSCSF